MTLKISNVCGCKKNTQRVMEFVNEIPAVEEVKSFKDVQGPFEECLMRLFRILFRNKLSLEELLMFGSINMNKITKKIIRLANDILEVSAGTELLEKFQHTIEMLLAWIKGELKLKCIKGPGNSKLLLYNFEEESDSENWYAFPCEESDDT